MSSKSLGLPTSSLDFLICQVADKIRIHAPNTLYTIKSLCVSTYTNTQLSILAHCMLYLLWLSKPVEFQKSWSLIYLITVLVGDPPMKYHLWG